MWILTKTPHGYIRLLNIRVTHRYIRLHIRRSGQTRKQNADSPASSGFSRPHATLRRVTVSLAFGLEKPRLAGWMQIWIRFIFLKTNCHLWKFSKKAWKKKNSSFKVNHAHVSFQPFLTISKLNRHNLKLFKITGSFVVFVGLFFHFHVFFSQIRRDWLMRS